MICDHCGNPGASPVDCEVRRDNVVTKRYVLQLCRNCEARETHGGPTGPGKEGRCADGSSGSSSSSAV